MPQGPPSRVPQSYARRLSPAQYHVATTDADRTENYFANHRMQPPSVFRQPLGFYNQRFRSSEGDVVVASLDVLPPEPIPIHGTASEPAAPHAAGKIKRRSRVHSFDGFHSLSSNASRKPALQDDETRQGESANQTTCESTNAIISTGEHRLPGVFGHKFHQPASTIVYIVFVVAVLAGISAGFIAYLGRYAASALLYEITDSEGDVAGSHAGPWAFSPRFKTGTSVTLKEKCRNPWCSKQMAALIHSLDAGVRPCQNFYGYVCTRSRVRNARSGNQLGQPTEQRMVAFLRGTSRPGREGRLVAASRRLWKDCADLATLKRLGSVPLHALLNRTGLGSWPYNRTDELPDVWEAAGKLLRLMELAPLVEVNVRPDNSLRLSRGHCNGTVGAAKVLDAMLAMRSDSSGLRQLAQDVTEFGYKMDALIHSHEPPISDHHLSDDDGVLRPFLQVALEGLRPDAGTVRTELDNFIDPLVELVRETRPETVLNLLGYRLVRHVGLFTPPAVNADPEHAELSKRSSRCTRAVLEDALTAEAADYVRYAALRSQLDFNAILSAEAHVKRVLHTKLAGLAWMDNKTREAAQQRLRPLKV
ncbi:uncharacterized protein LOC144146441 [Haemaphysalis longicornis]